LDPLEAEPNVRAFDRQPSGQWLNRQSWTMRLGASTSRYVPDTVPLNMLNAPPGRRSDLASLCIAPSGMSVTDLGQIAQPIYGHIAEGHAASASRYAADASNVLTATNTLTKP